MKKVFSFFLFVTLLLTNIQIASAINKAPLSSVTISGCVDKPITISTSNKTSSTIRIASRKSNCTISATPIDSSYTITNGLGNVSLKAGGNDIKLVVSDSNSETTEFALVVNYSASDGGTSTNGLTNPKTGEALPIIGLISIFCIGGYCFFVSNKRKDNKKQYK